MSPSVAGAHPHSRGENKARPYAGSLAWGSSPLTRGKLRGGRHFDLDPGLIPTHAGKTRRPCERSRGSRAHPHSRGENVFASGSAKNVPGSSPLTRGKHAGDGGRTRRDRLIPTHAGKTRFRGSSTDTATAHPHSRGENLGDDPDVHRAAGSSPLTRGKPLTAAARSPSMGLIPTHAGKTAQRHATAFKAQAHPHSRGENKKPTMTTIGSLGSSPLTRGKRTGNREQGDTPWLIPTHAGKTPCDREHAPPVEAHPHSRGENHRLVSGLEDAGGSSPLTRGKPLPASYYDDPARLIPTHAGKTVAPRVTGVRRRAHPHSRGENRRAAVVPRRRGGSSPLTRGKHRETHTRSNAHRLIPTHAGKTL